MICLVFIHLMRIGVKGAECCGTFIHVPKESRELTGAFTRIIPTGVLTVAPPLQPLLPATNSSIHWTSEVNDDTIPPSRVTDLKVQLDPVAQKVTFRWTAVGDDYDVGTGTMQRHLLTKLPIHKRMVFSYVQHMPTNCDWQTTRRCLTHNRSTWRNRCRWRRRVLLAN